jgi:hypothetical protein
MVPGIGVHTHTTVALNIMAGIVTAGDRRGASEVRTTKVAEMSAAFFVSAGAWVIVTSETSASIVIVYEVQASTLSLYKALIAAQEAIAATDDRQHQPVAAQGDILLYRGSARAARSSLRLILALSPFRFRKAQSASATKSGSRRF